MKKFVITLLISLGLLLAVGCSSISPVCATSNELGSKVGESTGVYLFGALPMGSCDHSIQAAAKKGGIKSISTVDQKVYVGIFTVQVTTIVTGE